MYRCTNSTRHESPARARHEKPGPSTARHVTVPGPFKFLGTAGRHGHDLFSFFNYFYANICILCKIYHYIHKLAVVLLVRRWHLGSFSYPPRFKPPQQHIFSDFFPIIIGPDGPRPGWRAGPARFPVTRAVLGQTFEPAGQFGPARFPVGPDGLGPCRAGRPECTPLGGTEDQHQPFSTCHPPNSLISHFYILA